jgi:NitT/TauT family transport system ATP-binding protein
MKNDVIPHILRVENAYQRYPGKNGSYKLIINDVTLRLDQGEFLTIVGPTGCGKSTLLRMILGSEMPACGDVFINGKSVVEPNPDCGVVFQNYSLYPNLTVRDNIMRGLEFKEFRLSDYLLKFWKLRKKRKGEFQEIADAYLKRVGLLEHGDKYPFELSGGMRQRAAIAQAMALKPKLLLMDEPLGALDVGTREAMQLFILEQWDKTFQTIVFVTHDLEEALFLGSRIIVLSQFWGEDDGKQGTGAKIVKDIALEWPIPRPTGFKHTEAFNKIMLSIRHEGFDPSYLQKVNEFDLTHEDAAWWKTVKGYKPSPTFRN